MWDHRIPFHGYYSALFLIVRLPDTYTAIQSETENLFCFFYEQTFVFPFKVLIQSVLNRIRDTEQRYQNLWKQRHDKSKLNILRRLAVVKRIRFVNTS